MPPAWFEVVESVNFKSGYMDTLSLITFVLGMILGSAMIIVATFVYWKKQIFPVGAIVMTVFGTLLLGLSIWQSAKIQVGADGNLTASFEKLRQEVKAEVKQSNQAVTEKIEDLKATVSTDSSTLNKLRVREQVDGKIERGDYEGAIRLDSTSVIAYMRLIEKLVGDGRYAEAIAYLPSLKNFNQSGVGYSVYPDLIFAYDQMNESDQAENLTKQLRIRVNEDMNNGYGYYSRSQQIGWLKDGLQKYLTSFKNQRIRASVADLVTELGNFISALTQ